MTVNYFFFYWSRRPVECPIRIYICAPHIYSYTDVYEQLKYQMESMLNYHFACASRSSFLLTIKKTIHPCPATQCVRIAFYTHSLCLCHQDNVKNLKDQKMSF